MGVPLTLKDIQSGFLTASAFNENNTLVEEALAKALNRTSNADDNAMEVDLDMGLNKIFNLAEAEASYEAVTLAQMLRAIGAIAEGSIAVLREPRITATGGQDTFTITSFAYTPGTNTLSVYINGVKQYSGVDYTETDSTTITTDTGLSSGDFVDIYLNQAI